MQFPIQQFQTASTGSFVIYLYNNYNADMTGKTFSMFASWTPGTYETRSTTCYSTPGYVRFEFQDVASGTYDQNDYWWSTGTDPLNSLNLDGGSTGSTLTVPLTDRSRWSNLCGKTADDQSTTGTDCITGGDVTTSAYQGFTNAVKKVKMVGLGFGSACRYASGVALDGGPGTFKLWSFGIAQ